MKDYTRSYNLEASKILQLIEDADKIEQEEKAKENPNLINILEKLYTKSDNFYERGFNSYLAGLIVGKNSSQTAITVKAYSDLLKMPKDRILEIYDILSSIENYNQLELDGILKGFMLHESSGEKDWYLANCILGCGVTGLPVHKVFSEINLSEDKQKEFENTKAIQLKLLQEGVCMRTSAMLESFIKMTALELPMSSPDINFSLVLKTVENEDAFNFNEKINSVIIATYISAAVMADNKILKPGHFKDICSTGFLFGFTIKKLFELYRYAYSITMIRRERESNDIDGICYIAIDDTLTLKEKLFVTYMYSRGLNFPERIPK